MSKNTDRNRFSVEAFIDDVIDLGDVFCLVSNMAGFVKVEKTEGLNIHVGDGMRLVADMAATQARGDMVYVAEEGATLLRDQKEYASVKIVTPRP